MRCTSCDQWVRVIPDPDMISVFLCRDCTTYFRAQQDLTENIQAFGTQMGAELGVERAIRDTIYQYPQDEYYTVPDIDIPMHVRFNKRVYTRAFEDAQMDMYLKTYQIHRRVLEQLEQQMVRQTTFGYLAWKYESHAHLEANLFKIVLRFLPIFSNEVFKGSISV